MKNNMATLRLTVDDVASIQDQLEDFLFGLVGQDVQFQRNPDVFSIEVLRKQHRKPMAPAPDSDLSVEGRYLS